jgi:hypothetical protein
MRGAYTDYSVQCKKYIPQEPMLTPLKDEVNKEPMEWVEKYRKDFNEIWEPLFDVSSWKEVGNSVKEFNIKFIKSQIKQAEERERQRIVKEIYENI